MFRVIILFLSLELAYIKSYAQFYTISVDPSEKKRLDYEMLSQDTINAYISPNLQREMMSEDRFTTSKRERELFPAANGLEISVEKNVPVFVSVKNTPLLELIQKRVTVCLPLDYLKLNSNYGFRSDPILQCKKFHDGIDLKCNYERVYSMLPGIVKEVHRGNRGYGNYVVLQHGSIECLYGHLSVITVNENDVVEAGDIVAISGNTGKSTGPHLHLRLRKDGKSIDPKPFVN